MKYKYDPVSNDLLDHYFPPSSEDNKEEDEIPLGVNLSVDDEDIPNNKRWQPKKWKPVYEQIVMLDLMGLKQYEIAEKIGYTTQQVNNILCCDQAIAIQKAMVGRIRNEGISIVDELEEIQKLTVKRLKQCLKNDDDFKTSKLGFIGKGLEVMKGLGEHLKPAPSQVTNNFTLPPSVADRFLKGLEKSDEARKLLVEKAS